MTDRIDLFYNTYGNFREEVLQAIREDTYGDDIGQNSWLTVEEFDRFIAWLGLPAGAHVLEVSSGSGGPARYLARAASCRVTGIDLNELGVGEANASAKQGGIADRVSFQVADATQPLPFADATFDGLVCIDSMNHFPNRLEVFLEWKRVLKRGGRALFTDPVVITGPVTNDELALRSSIGVFLFVPPGVNEGWIEEAGLRLVQMEDASRNAALTSGRWHASRERHRDALIQMEGEARFEGLQNFFAAVHNLTAERRLSRILYVAEKPAI